MFLRCSIKTSRCVFASLPDSHDLIWSRNFYHTRDTNPRLTQREGKHEEVPSSRHSDQKNQRQEAVERQNNSPVASWSLFWAQTRTFLSGFGLSPRAPRRRQSARKERRTVGEARTNLFPNVCKHFQVFVHLLQTAIYVAWPPSETSKKTTENKNYSRKRVICVHFASPHVPFLPWSFRLSAIAALHSNT